MFTDPYNPTPASYVTDDIGNYTTLDFPSSIVTTTIDSSTYALVTSRTDDGVQIIDITDPYNPTPVTDIIDDRDGFTTLLMQPILQSQPLAHQLMPW